MLRAVAFLFGLSCVMSYLNALSSKLYSNPKLISRDRQKRFFEPLFSIGTTNIVKAVLGVSYPLETYDAVNFRTMNLGYNFQAQYMLRTPTQLPWWADAGRSLQKQKKDHFDNTRQIVYSAVENLMARKGINGKECLQRAICENVQSPITVTGIFHDILNLFLSPNEKEVDKCYIDAKNAGMNGADCLQLYKNCPMGHGFFDSIFKVTSEFMH